MIRVAIRFDDPSRNSSRLVEHGLIAALREYKLSATFAVIPFSPRNGEFVPLTADVVQHLMKAANEGVIELAQHGFRHQRRSATEGEFSGRSFDEQWQMIHAGKAQLEQIFGRRLLGFVPPFNSCNQQTVDCLEKMGFIYLSAGWDRYISNRVAMLPRTCNVFDIAENVRALRKANLEGVVIGVMHHYDFHEDEGSEASRGLADFSTLLAWLKEQPDIEVTSLATLANDVSTSKWRYAYKVHHIAHKLPWRCKQRLPTGCLLTSPPWRVALTALFG